MLLYFSLFLNFFSLFFGSTTDREMKKEDQLAHTINHEITEKFKQQYNLNCFGFSLAGPNKIEQMCLIFNLDKILNKDDLRQLIVKCTEEYFSAISSQPELHPYLCDSFSIKNIEIVIYINDEKGKEAIFPNIGGVRHDWGTVRYTYWDVEEDGECYIKSRECEPYEEALKVVKNKE